jgi:hypothetical protein
MHDSINPLWKQAAIIALLLGVDLAVSLPIMGATYRPFSWMSMAPAGTATLYPVIQNLTFSEGKPSLSAEVGTGSAVLQRSTNLLNATGWIDVASTPANGQVIQLTDTNPVTAGAFYRVKRILTGAP